MINHFYRMYRPTLFVTIVKLIPVIHTRHSLHYSALNSTRMKYQSHDEGGGALVAMSQ